MKKVKFKGKLLIDKKAVTQLDDSHLAALRGGRSGPTQGCSGSCNCPPTTTDSCNGYANNGFDI